MLISGYYLSSLALAHRLWGLQRWEMTDRKTAWGLNSTTSRPWGASILSPLLEGQAARWVDPTGCIAVRAEVLGFQESRLGGILGDRTAVQNPWDEEMLYRVLREGD